MSKTWGFFGGSGHGHESSCQISAYYKFFPGFSACCRISTGLICERFVETLLSILAQLSCKALNCRLPGLFVSTKKTFQTSETITSKT